MSDTSAPPNSAWSPAQYSRFKSHRGRAPQELLARVPLESPGLIYDLGCGGGEGTALLRRRYPKARIIGIDSSEAMLDAARRSGVEAEWRLGDLGAVEVTGSPDLIYSNAAYHWVDNHDALFPRLMRSLAPGGIFAAQMPLSWQLASHRLMRALLSMGGQGGKPLGTDALQAALDRRPVASAKAYYEILNPLSAEIDIWESEYLHVLEGENPVFEWVKGAGLKRVSDALEGDERGRFLRHYEAEISQLYPREAGGETLYPFRRLFLVASKG